MVKCLKMEIKESLKIFLKNPYNLAFLLILLIAFIIRVKYLFAYTVWPDEALYVWYGHSILSNPSYIFSQEFTHTISYLPSIVIAFFDIFTNSFIAGRLMSLTFSIIGIVLIYLIGKELGNELIGLISAILLTFSLGHWFNTDRILLDVPLTTMFTLVAYSLIKYEKTSKKIWFYVLILASALTVYTKSAGVLVVPLLVLYFLTKYRLNVLSLFKRKEIRYGVIIFIILIIPLIIINFVNFGRATVEDAGSYITSNKEDVDFLRPSKDLLFNISLFVLPISLIGLLFALYYRKKEHILLIIWIITIYGFFTILHPQTVDRYLLPVAPAFFLLAGLAVYEISILINKQSKIIPWLFVIGIALLMMPLYVQGNSLIKDKSYSYIGFKEAGEWINKNAEDDAVIFTYSTRAIRIFTEREFDIYDGTLTGPGATKEEFEDKLNKIDKPIYFLIDTWEFIQPQWFFPITEEKIAYIESKGFELVYVVEKEMPGNDEKLVKTPVIAIFKLSKSSK